MQKLQLQHLSNSCWLGTQNRTRTYTCPILQAVCFEFSNPARLLFICQVNFQLCVRLHLASLPHRQTRLQKFFRLTKRDFLRTRRTCSHKIAIPMAGRHSPVKALLVILGVTNCSKWRLSGFAKSNPIPGWTPTLVWNQPFWIARILRTSSLTSSLTFRNPEAHCLYSYYYSYYS